MNKTQLLSTIGLLGSLATSQAAWSLLDDFESYTAGELTAQSSSWYEVSGMNEATVVVDGANKYFLQGTTNNSHTVFDNGSTLIADNAIGTYFFRAYMPSATHGGTAISPSSTTDNDGWGDGKAIIRFGNNPTNETIYAYNTPTYDALTDGTANAQTVSGAWYNIWVLVDNQTTERDYDVYIQSNDDSGYSTQTLVGSDLGFRTNVPDGSLESLFFRSALNGTGVRYDDLYIDSTTHNLANPVPEPTVSLLGALGLLGLLRRRR
jgi:hypothetical protein